MSRATMLPTDVREAHYRTQTGRTDLTPAQARRSRHKANDQARPTPRIGRLRRRYDAKDTPRVHTHAHMYAAILRNRIGWTRHTAKPDSKTQRRKAGPL